MSTPDLPISQELQANIMADAVASTHFAKEQITLSMLSSWDNAKCPIVEAKPNAFDYYPLRYAVVGGEILPASGEKSYAKIIRTCFPDLAKENPLALARLSVMFANFEAPVGIVWQRDLSVDHPEISTPTKEFKPLLKKDGAATVLEFYTYSSPLSKFYFCQVIFNGEEPEIKAKELN